ncbi:pyridoxine 5'-phosphate oxidase C-terminal domain-containing protein [Actinoplanes sp. NPDC026619]|uniref:pyridoxine 5'-phosphate oxidase C-terminal domain-containing protein n=1 Tax=Actinoplanes sp. NPDC026619 TaxID=3155798 RepID=UPI0033F93672
MVCRFCRAVAAVDPQAAAARPGRQGCDRRGRAHFLLAAVGPAGPGPRAGGDPDRLHVRLRYTRGGGGWSRNLLWP